MIIRNAHFRLIYQRPIIIKGEEISKEMARYLKIDSVMDDGLSSEELKERIDAIKIDESINAILVIPYIDHTAGISFHLLATASLIHDSVNIFKREDSVMMNIRKDHKVNDLEFEYLENLNVNDDFDLDDYTEAMEIADSYSDNDEIEQLRSIGDLDQFRHEDYPDDVEVLFYKEGLQIEKMWVRYERIIDMPLIEGRLLNQPYQDFGVGAGDAVRFFPYRVDDDIVLICNLDDE